MQEKLKILIPYIFDSRNFSSVWYQPNDRRRKGSISSSSQVSLNFSNFYYILEYLFLHYVFTSFFHYCRQFASILEKDYVDQNEINALLAESKVLSKLIPDEFKGPLDSIIGE